MWGDGVISETTLQTQDETFLDLRILGTTDLHANIWPVDYIDGRETPNSGLAALSQTIEDARNEGIFTLLFDNGDFLQGTPLGDLAADEILRSDDLIHPMIAAMNALQYDAGTLGNHDFNYGLEVLENCIAQSSFPFVTSNIQYQDPAVAPLTHRHLILTRDIPDSSGKSHRLKIGLIGATPPQTIQWDRAHLGDTMVAQDTLSAARHSIDALQAEGCDLIVGLSHSGIGSPKPAPYSENTSLALAALEGVDAVIAGHSHEEFPGPDITPRPGLDTANGQFNGKPAILPGVSGQHLGVIDLKLTQHSDGWRVVGSRSELRPCSHLDRSADAGIAPTPALILHHTEHLHRKTETTLSRTIGHTEQALDGQFAPLICSGSEHLTAAAQQWRARQLLASTGAEDLPVLAATCPFTAGGPAGPFAFTTIPKGPLQLRHLVQLSPFPNQLCVIKVSGGTLRRWLERAVSGFKTLCPDSEPGFLLHRDAACYNFDTIHGVDYEIDLSKPALFSPTGTPLDTNGTGRIANLSYRGTSVGMDDAFYVATNSYRAAGGGGFTMLEAAPDAIFGTGPLRDEIEAYVQDIGIYTGKPEHIRRFKPIGASAYFDSHPDAQADSLSPTDPKARRLGLQENGFCRFLVTI